MFLSRTVVKGNTSSPHIVSPPTLGAAAVGKMSIGFQTKQTVCVCALALPLFGDGALVRYLTSGFYLQNEYVKITSSETLFLSTPHLNVIFTAISPFY